MLDKKFYLKQGVKRKTFRKAQKILDNKKSYEIVAFNNKHKYFQYLTHRDGIAVKLKIKGIKNVDVDTYKLIETAIENESFNKNIKEFIENEVIDDLDYFKENQYDQD